jgi:hypothetical protein
VDHDSGIGLFMIAFRHWTVFEPKHTTDDPEKIPIKTLLLQSLGKNKEYSVVMI